MTPFNVLSLPIVLADLDDTLFQTERKVPSGVSVEQCMVGSVDAQGEASGLLTPQQQQFYHWLNSTTELIPVTARSAEQLNRVRLPFSSWKIMTQGAVILDANDEPHLPWKEKIIDAVRPWQEKLAKLRDEIGFRSKEVNLDLLCRVINAYETHGIYVNVKSRDKSAEGLQAMSNLCAQYKDSWLTQGGWFHENGNNISFFVPAVKKEAAVQYLLTHLIPDASSRVVMGMGDSLTDAAFMELAHWRAFPAKTQLDKKFQSIIHQEDIDNHAQ